MREGHLPVKERRGPSCRCALFGVRLLSRNSAPWTWLREVGVAVPLAVCDAPMQSGCCQYQPRSSPTGVLNVDVRAPVYPGPVSLCGTRGIVTVCDVRIYCQQNVFSESF